jgi:dipeptidyl aminopeptidase/acylaminoacyl peptidase
MSLLVQTKRFKAAVESAGFSDLIADYGQMRSDGTAYGMLLETGQGLMGGTPWQYRERYIQNSPFFYFDRIETPLLMIHGAEDPFVQAYLADQVFVGLRRLGKEVEYAKYGGEAHWLTSYENQVDAWSRIISWFDRFLKAPEHAPNADAGMVH